MGLCFIVPSKLSNNVSNVDIVTDVIGREQIEEIELRDRLKDSDLSSSKGKQEPKPQTEDKVKDQELGKWGTLDVLGQPAEPICNYYGCHHKFSLHGSRRCRCKHPTNKTLGIQVRYL